MKRDLQYVIKDVADRHERYGGMFKRAEEELQDLEKLQNLELQKIMDTFKEVREAIDKREKEFRETFKQRSKDQYSHLCKETANLRFVFGEINHLYENVQRLQNLMELVDDYTVVGSCGRIDLFRQSF